MAIWLSRLKMNETHKEESFVSVLQNNTSRQSVEVLQLGCRGVLKKEKIIKKGIQTDCKSQKGHYFHVNYKV